MVMLLTALWVTLPLCSIAQSPKTFIRLDGGYVGYNADYRGSIDTPFAEKNILQHSINASLNLTVAGRLPFIANAWIRRSNSSFFRDINDVQVIFNTAQYRKGVMDSMKAKWLALSGNRADSQVINAYQRKKAELEGLRSKLKNPLSLQKLIEAGEILKMPKKTYDYSLPDSTNQRRSDSLQRLAKAYVEMYEHTKKAYDSLQRTADSLHTLYETVLRRQQQYKDMIRSGGQGYSWQQMEQALRERTGDSAMPARYKWLMGVRAFSLGKSAANYSELTAKNTNLTGVNFVY
ncbi:MAG TPA: hypothetical protein VHD83_06005, partial [Puia sp.]|nr:hypothetical protein [Puia sp.]